MYKLAVIVASDKGAAGEREDKSGKTIREIMENNGFETVGYAIVKDEIDELKSVMVNFSDSIKADLILTTGGTGFSSRDVTPEATLQVCGRLAPGIAEAMRAAGMAKTPKAMLSRAVAGIRGNTLIINLPGSPKAVGENLEAILPALPHGLDILRGDASECARQDEKSGQH